jgi:hypothetical protein
MSEPTTQEITEHHYEGTGNDAKAWQEIDVLLKRIKVLSEAVKEHGEHDPDCTHGLDGEIHPNENVDCWVCDSLGGVK